MLVSDDLGFLFLYVYWFVGDNCGRFRRALRFYLHICSVRVCNIVLVSLPRFVFSGNRSSGFVNIVCRFMYVNYVRLVCSAGLGAVRSSWSRAAECLV